MPRIYKAENVFQATVNRLVSLYADGHRVVHSFSGGKDSLVVLECAIIAAQMTNRLPVELVLRDEELGFPDHYEYCERVANRPEVDFTWIVAREPHSYAFSREQPFWWAFDPRMPDKWVRRYPPYAEEIQEITIEAINTTKRFPPPDGKRMITTIGIRAGESRNRMLGVFSMGGWLTNVAKDRKQGAWPIYDWSDKDVWTAIKELNWDYPKAYADLARFGVPRRQLRMGAFLNRYAVSMLPVAAKIWPAWFERLYARFPGLRVAMKLGERLTRPTRRAGESWEECFYRENVDNAPKWIAERSLKVVEYIKRNHPRHSTMPIAQEAECLKCGTGRGSWSQLAEGMYLGDPFSEFPASVLPYMQPEDFRPELKGTVAGRWGGHPG